MPTILIIEGFRFFFFSNEGNEPPHVHVEKDNALAKYWLTPTVTLAKSYGYNSVELNKMLKLVEQNSELFKEKWYGYFGR